MLVDNPDCTRPAFSSIDCVGQCMMDLERSKAFDLAIRNTVHNDAHVLDVGTGSGLLALMAARCNVRRVTALEFDPYLVSVAARNVRDNSLSEIVEVVRADATTHRFPAGSHFDVVIMELLTTGLIDESQIRAVNNLHGQGVVNQSTQFIPRRQNTSVYLAHVSYEVLGIQMKMVRHLWNDFYRPEELTPLTGLEHLHSVDFHTRCPEQYAGTVSLQAKKSGTVNAIVFCSSTDLTNDLALGSTLAMNAPVVYPLPELRVECGQQVQASVSYRFGEGFGGMEVHIIENPSS
jgi:predicted RNA methylase